VKLVSQQAHPIASPRAFWPLKKRHGGRFASILLQYHMR
jgi:hypothetical protein